MRASYQICYDCGTKNKIKRQYCKNPECEKDLNLKKPPAEQPVSYQSMSIKNNKGLKGLLILFSAIVIEILLFASTKFDVIIFTIVFFFIIFNLLNLISIIFIIFTWLKAIFDKKRRFGDVTAYLIPLVLLIISISFLYYGQSIVVNGHQSKSWPTTYGIIISSEIIWQGEDKTSSIKYSYTADEINYEASRINYCFDCGSTKYVSKYPTGRNVLVYYDENNPENAVLEPGVINYSFLSTLFILVFAIFAWSFIWEVSDARVPIYSEKKKLQSK